MQKSAALQDAHVQSIKQTSFTQPNSRVTSVNNSAAESLKMSVPIENSLDQDNVADEQGMQNVPRISARATLHSEQEQTNPTQTHSRIPSDILDASEIAKLK